MPWAVKINPAVSPSLKIRKLLMLKKSIDFLFFLAFLVFAANAPAENRVPRIIGGSDAQAGAHPYMVSIHFPDTAGGHACGGSLIASNWVLTAAHCLDGEQADGVFVYTGLYQQSNPGQADYIAVKRFIQHPNYDREQTLNDVALLELSSHATETPVVLNVGGPMPDTSFALGWGLTMVNGMNSDTLQYLNLPLVSNQACSGAYSPLGISIQDYHICAGYFQGGKDTCQNDSGGPLLIATGSGVQQVGIVSFGVAPDGSPCAGANSYGVYSRVSSFVDFIRQHVASIQTGDTGASLSQDLVLTIPSLLWSSASPQQLTATLRHVPGSEYTFSVENHSPINAQQQYAANLSNDLELTLQNITLWDKRSIWATLQYDASQQGAIVFSVVDYGSN